MTTKNSLSLQEVLPTAKRFLDEIADLCVECQIAGSLRRVRPCVGDIEVVAIPIRPYDLLGELDEKAPTALAARLESWRASTRIRIEKNGPRYKKLSILLPCRMRIPIDLFLTTSERWPITLAVRTGPADYSQQLVTQRVMGGLLQNGYRVRDGRLWHERRPVELRDERHFFEFIDGGFVQPSDRGR